MGSVFKDQTVKDKMDCLTLEDGTDRSSYSHHSTLRKNPPENTDHFLSTADCCVKEKHDCSFFTRNAEVFLTDIISGELPFRELWESPCRHLGDHHSVKQRSYNNLAFFSSPKRPGQFWDPPRVCYQVVKRLRLEADHSPPCAPWLRTSATVLTLPYMSPCCAINAALTLGLTCFLKRV